MPAVHAREQVLTVLRAARTENNQLRITTRNGNQHLPALVVTTGSQERSAPATTHPVTTVGWADCALRQVDCRARHPLRVQVAPRL
jgi:hypothetical protein